MATLPRLPARLEYRVVKAALGLPPRLQRRLFGAPKEIDGQVLAPDIHALLRLAELTDSTSLFEGMTVEEARASSRAEARVISGPTPLPMERVESLEIPGPGGPIPCRFYLPPGLPAGVPKPLLVYYHGGGWVIGDLDTHDSACRILAAASGTAVLAVDYRLAPEHPFPAPVEDAWAAYAWAEANAASLGVDPGRIAVGGDSAGGNLASLTAITARDRGGPMPAMQLMIYPVTDSAEDPPSRLLFAKGFLINKADMDLFEAAYVPLGVDVADPRISILKTPDLSGLPPAYLATAGFDPLRDEGEAYALRMREAGVRVALRRHSGLVHTFVNLTAISRSARAAMLEAAGALRMGLAS